MLLAPPEPTAKIDMADAKPFHWEYVPDPGDLPRTLVARNGSHRPNDGSGYDIPVITHYRRAPRR